MSFYFILFYFQFHFSPELLRSWNYSLNLILLQSLALLFTYVAATAASFNWFKNADLSRYLDLIPFFLNYFYLMVLPMHRFYLHIIQNKVFHLSVWIFWHVDHRVQTLKLNKQNAHVKLGESRQFSLVFLLLGEGGGIIFYRQFLSSPAVCWITHTAVISL